MKSEVGCMKSDIRPPTSDFLLPISYFRPPTSDFRPPASYFIPGNQGLPIPSRNGHGIVARIIINAIKNNHVAAL